jgi:hypothetical protein
MVSNGDATLVVQAQKGYRDNHIARAKEQFMNRAERLANARLIAAAPMLKDLLVRAYEAYFDREITFPDQEISTLLNRLEGNIG